MEEIGSYPDGRKLLTASPIWSGSFVAISVSCLALILFTTYIILRHFQTLGFSGTVLLAVFIGVQSFYQWWRAVIYLRKMRVLYATAGFEQSGDGSTLDIVLRLAARSITDLLYYHFGMVIVCLVLSDVLLFRIDGLK
jgi:hypothetical protein